MNCPCAVLIFRQGVRSYRELPLRLAEFGSCHRYEPSGALHGLMRVRAFLQDDAHIFCTEEQIADETVRFVALIASVYRDFGFPDFSREVQRPPAGARRQRRGVGQGRGGAEGRLRARRASSTRSIPARARSTARSSNSCCATPSGGTGSAAPAGGLRPAGAARRRIRRRRRRPPPAGDAAPGDLRQLRALPRHPHRALCRPLPAVAGAGAGGGGDHRLRCRRLCREVAAACARGAGRGGRPRAREDQRQDPRAQPRSMCR